MSFRLGLAWLLGNWSSYLNITRQSETLGGQTSLRTETATSFLQADNPTFAGEFIV